MLGKRSRCIFIKFVMCLSVTFVIYNFNSYIGHIDKTRSSIQLGYRRVYNATKNEDRRDSNSSTTSDPGYLLLTSKFVGGTRDSNKTKTEHFEAIKRICNGNRPGDTWNEVTTYNPNYVTSGNVTDILSMEPIKFNKRFKNPCWIESYGRDAAKLKLHCLPYFLIAGFMKSATTDLHMRLGQHRHVILPYKKELKFWTRDRFSGVTLQEHARHNAEHLITQSMEKGDGNCSAFVFGDASPMTISKNNLWRLDPHNCNNSDSPRYLTLHSIRHAMPEVKVIVIMRNPADRIYSAYYYLYPFRNDVPGNLRILASPRDFHRQTVLALRALDKCRETRGIRMCIADFQTIIGAPNTIEDYVMTFYATIVSDWLQVFPRDQLLFIRMEDYAMDTRKYLETILSFLDLDPMRAEVLVKATRLSRNNEQHTYPPMNNETRELIDLYYRDERHKLSSLLYDDRFLWKEFVLMK